jgi:hypothetical protein
LNPDAWDVGPSRTYCDSTRMTAMIATSVLPCCFSTFQADRQIGRGHTAPVGAQMRRFSFVFIAVGWTMLCILFNVT